MHSDILFVTFSNDLCACIDFAAFYDVSCLIHGMT